MRIALINEVSASHRNADVLSALHEVPDAQIYNVGMQNPEQKPELTYIQTGLMAALLLNANICDMVIGGCGTGQGFLNSVMQYPNVFCGLITDPLDAWLFSQINGGNCVSLALNKGYGWAGDIHLKYMMRELFRDPPGAGYPPHRQESQSKSRKLLQVISAAAHKDMLSILREMDPAVYAPLTQNEAFWSLLTTNGNENSFVNSICLLLQGNTEENDNP